MTATTAESTPSARRMTDARVRFGLAFGAGLLAVLALGAGALYAYDRSYEGRILPGVVVGSVDVSGLDPGAARDQVAAAYSAVRNGELVLRAGSRTVSVPYADLGRRIDVDGLVDEALSVGRTGSPIERVIGNARTTLRGVQIEPSVSFDEDALAARIEAAAASLDRDPVDGSVEPLEAGYRLVPGSDGAVGDRETPYREAAAALARLDAPARLEVEVPAIAIEPWITTEEAADGKAAAERMARDLDVVVGDERFTIRASTIRTWLRLTTTVDGRLVPVITVTPIRETLKPIHDKIKIEPRNASFLVDRDNKVIGATAGRNGRALNFASTTNLVMDALLDRQQTLVAAAVTAATIPLKPSLSTEQAEQVAPLMKRISTWTTYFPISEKNGFGANIWIPAEDIDGYVVAPGEWFDFWEAVGPVTRERGYRAGGAIINGRTEPQGALAGGICSCSTTLFNAALRAGFEMGDRRNHYYYIDRYPLGLDATVFKSASGSVQTMSWRNDTEYPVLIRGFRIRDGNDGYVRFDLYSVPNGRKVSFTKPVVKNVRPASDSVQLTSSLKPGARQRIEYPVDGKDVWVTRTVRDAAGNVIHQETYYSHYARITGIVLVGKPAAAPPADTAEVPAAP